jgi:hypothetical protein
MKLDDFYISIYINNIEHQIDMREKVVEEKRDAFNNLAISIS